jgi:glycosyltransferase involved in cell wall biosynthesis
VKTDELLDVAIASVLKQTYQRLEIIVVNDGPNRATRDAISKLNDSRIRYVEFREQQRYPDDPHLRWMVAGSPGMNRGAEMASGSWIAPLDDDDEFTADHVEKLVALALREKAELAYGALIQKHLTHNTENLIWSDPPAINQFSFMGALYMKPLNFFKYDQQSWIVDEPADWNLIRRMSAAGVQMACTADIVGTMYSVSYTEK